MSADRQHDVDDLYKKAQRILMHELTPDEQSLVSSLALENHATLSEERFAKLKELVRTKGHKQSGTS